MPTRLRSQNSISIHSPIDTVWVAVTNPNLIKQWFFGFETESDWQVGSSIVHRGINQGLPYQDKGTIQVFKPPTTFIHSHWSPVYNLPDDEENYQNVTYSLFERGAFTDLTVTELNLPNMEAKLTSDTSWQSALNGLKQLLEKELIR